MNRRATASASLVMTLVIVGLGRAGDPPAPPKNSEETLREKIDIAEKQVAIKRAHLKLAEAYKAHAVVSLEGAKSLAEPAKATLEEAERKLATAKRLFKEKVLAESELSSDNASYANRRNELAEYVSRTRVAEAQVAIEDARCDVARAELDEMVLRLQQLRARLDAKKP